MNKNQRLVLLATATLIAIMTLMPPFHQINVKGLANRHYYDFIFASKAFLVRLFRLERV